MFAESKLIIESENCLDWHPPPSVRVRGADTDNYRHNKHVIKQRPVSFDFQTDLNLWLFCSLSWKIWTELGTKHFCLHFFRCSIELGMSGWGMRMIMLSPSPGLVTVMCECQVWHVSVTRSSRWSPHSWQCPVTSYLCPVIVRNSGTTQNSSVRLIKISFFSCLDTFSSSSLTRRLVNQSLTFSGAMQMFSEYKI